MSHQSAPQSRPLELVPNKSQSSAQVFNSTLLRRLQVTNRCIRWLRKNGVKALQVDVHAATPTVLVSERAAVWLRREAFRRGLRCFSDHTGGSLFIDDCALSWRSTKT
ncbi:hypothetical protein H3H36_10860 [Duganella sp. FT3S]|uniref:Uncharacterized protein n=1 Tax=Rugamonas fusca TaxID=2758568 RepID=A0A7W2EH61_9BURK|nr:hypothetical protein [Rugamonas fusca]MBA5605859.1 hypothetical protein [Rugamonas fusca]